MALSKNTIKFIRTLYQKKFRQKYNKFIAEGDKIVGELLRQDAYPVLEVFASPKWAEQNSELLLEKQISCTDINEAELKLISQLTSPNQVLAVVGKAPLRKNSSLVTNWSLYLDGLQDPGNVGTILRIADWFAIPNVIAGPGTVDLYNSKTLQATMGAFLRVHCWEASLTELKAQAPDTPIWGATMTGANVFELTTPSSGILVIGNEGKGIREEHLELLDQQVAIAAPKDGGAESLNAGVATGILCAALRR